MNLKKLLSTIGIISATLTGSLNIVACNNTKSDNSSEKINNIEKSKNETNKTNEVNNIEVSKNETNKTDEVNNVEVSKKEKEISIPLPPPLPPLPVPTINKTVPSQETKRKKREINNISLEEELKAATDKINKKKQIKDEKNLKNNAIIAELEKETTQYSITLVQGIDNKESLYTKINSKFISCQLNEDLKNYFNQTDFAFDCINVFSEEWSSWIQITDSDLNTENTLKTKIRFYYQKKQYQAELNINIISAEKYIINKISENSYNLNISSKTTFKDIEKQITDLIPTKILDKDLKNYLIENSNKLIIKNKIFNKDKKELSLNELLNESSAFKATIKFSFNDVEAELPLVITIIGAENISNVLNQTTNKILNSDAQNITTVKKGTNLDTFKTNLSSNVREYYENSEIANIFNPENFKITSIYKIKKTNENEKTKVKELKSKDFNNFQELELQVNYTYEKNDGKFMLVLTILPDLEDINSSIKNATYTKQINNKISIEEFKNSIDYKFINTSLQPNIQKYFDAKKLIIEEITNSSNNPITKADLIANTTLYINYNYEGMHEKASLILKDKENKFTPNKDYQNELKEILKKRREAIAPKEDE